MNEVPLYRHRQHSPWLRDVRGHPPTPRVWPIRDFQMSDLPGKNLKNLVAET
jgi:hypothetical protein